MTSELDAMSWDSADLKGPARDFADYCRAEKDRRMNSDTSFDVELFDEAVELVLRKLGALELEEYQ